MIDRDDVQRWDALAIKISAQDTQSKKSMVTHAVEAFITGLVNELSDPYTGIGLFGFVVSQLTSTITDKRRLVPALLMKEGVKK